MLFDRPAVRCFYIRGKACKYAKEHVCNGEDFEDLPGDLKICKGRDKDRDGRYRAAEREMFPEPEISLA